MAVVESFRHDFDLFADGNLFFVMISFFFSCKMILSLKFFSLREIPFTSPLQFLY